MKRDLDLIRKILQAMESHEHGFAPSNISIEGYDDEQIGFHVYLAGQAGLLNVVDFTNTRTASPLAKPTSLTWQGYEFLEASRDEGLWSKAKQAAGSAGGMALGVVNSVLVELATEAAKKAAGVR